MNSAKRIPIIVSVLLSLCCWATAEVPPYINYQGRLIDADGFGLDSTADLTFHIYADSEGGSPLWTETIPDVIIENGLFNVRLGEITPFPDGFWDGSTWYLGVQVNGGDESTPRLPTITVPYAFKAVSADTAAYAHAGPGSGSTGWVDDGTRVHLVNIGDSVGIGTSTPGYPLEVVSAGTAISGRTTGSGTYYGVMGTGPNGGIGVTGTSDTYTGVLGASNSGTAIHGISLSGFAGAFYGPKNYFSGKVGIGVLDPDAWLDVEGPNIAVRGVCAAGTAVIGYSNTGIGVYGHSESDYAGYFNGPRSYFSNDVSIGTMLGDERLHVENSDSYPARSFLKIEASHLTAWGECGIRFKTTANTWHFRMDDYTNNNLPIAGSLSLRSQNINQEVMTWASNGRVGIGDTSPDAKLDVVGDLQLSGAYRGHLSSSSGSDGAPFPRPAYNSGWIDIEADDCLMLDHNVGGDADDYFVDVQIKSTGGIGIHNLGFGGYYEPPDQYMGILYENLTATQILVCRLRNDIPANQIRVRIWVIN
jgi:hypothetical protein